MENRPPDSGRRLAAFWFADIVGFTTLSARDEDAALAAVGALRSSAMEEVKRAGGQVVKVSGDMVLAEFSSADASLRSALALRDVLATRVPLHIGVHLGDVTDAHDDIYGDGVNTAARLQAHAGAGQVLVSEDIFRHLRASKSYEFESIGRLELKGLETPLGAYSAELRVEAAGGAPDRVEPVAARPAVTAPPVARAPTAPAVAQGSNATRMDGPTATTRLIVTPFRMLRPDEETDFLSFSLADAVSFSLSNLESIVVRSSHLAGTDPARTRDLREVARQTDVDMVVSGTLLRVGDRLQVTAELTDGRDGTRLGSFRTQAGLGDLFDLQEDLTGQIVGSLRLPITVQDHRQRRRDVPASSKAYELYLRGKELAHRTFAWEVPREMFRASVQVDPTWAPAWADLGRCHRLIGKYDREERQANMAEAEVALARALELDPELDLAHSYAAQLETDLGRGGDAMARLLERLNARPRGVHLLAGLVQALRYCGLLEESVAAHEAARAIDGSARTSVAFTHFVRGDYDRCLKSDHGTDFFVQTQALLMLDRSEEAAALARRSLDGLSPKVLPYARPTLLLAEGHVADALRLGTETYFDFPDPEGRFLFARMAAHLKRPDLALEVLGGVAPEYGALPEPGVDPWLASVDRTTDYGELLAGVVERREGCRRRYEELNGGWRLR